MNIQDELNKITRDLIDPDCWSIIVKDDMGNTVASVRSIIGVASVASLISVKYPSYTVYIKRHNLSRRAYKEGKVLSEEECPNLKDFIPNATEARVHQWNDIS